MHRGRILRAKTDQKKTLYLSKSLVHGQKFVDEEFKIFSSSVRSRPIQKGQVCPDPKNKEAARTLATPIGFENPKSASHCRQF